MNFEKFSEKLLQATQRSDFVVFLKLITENPDYTWRVGEVCRQKSRDTLAHVSVSSGCVDILRYLCETCKLTNLLVKENFEGKNALHVAVQFSQAVCVRYLISCGVPVDPLKRSDWTPLMLASTKNNVNIVEMLLHAGANPRLINKDGWNALHIACRVGQPEIISSLLKKDPLLWKTKSKNGRTPLHTAALHGQVEAVEILLRCAEYMADEKDSCGTTPLMDAATANNVPIIMLLIDQQKASLHSADALGRTIMHLAAQAGSVDVINYLVFNYNIDIWCHTSHGQSPLDLAMKENQVKAVQLLLSLTNMPSPLQQSVKPCPQTRTAINQSWDLERDAEHLTGSQVTSILDCIEKDYDQNPESYNDPEKLNILCHCVRIKLDSLWTAKYESLPEEKKQEMKAARESTAWREEIVKPKRVRRRRHIYED